MGRAVVINHSNGIWACGAVENRAPGQRSRPEFEQNAVKRTSDDQIWGNAGALPAAERRSGRRRTIPAQVAGTFLGLNFAPKKSKHTGRLKQNQPKNPCLRGDKGVQQECLSPLLQA
jgi:hypothetical protein